MAVIDSIVSMPAALMPWKEMVAICNSYPRSSKPESEPESNNTSEGETEMVTETETEVWSVIDAAHSLGQEQGIDLVEVKPDFWISVRTLPLFIHSASAAMRV